MTGRPTIRALASERWLGATAPVGRVSRTMALVAGASLLAHLAVVGTVGVAARTAAPAPHEIAVELVQDVPKPVAKKPDETAKNEAAKPEPAKPEQTKPEKQARLEAAKPEQAKPEPPKPETSQADKPQPEPKAEPKRKVVEPKPKPEPPAPKPKLAAAPKRAAAPAQDEATAEGKLAALQHELDSLKAEQEQLQADRASQSMAERGADLTPTPAALRDTGLGLLPNSFQAVALPSTTDGPGEAASYEAIVFSALAKAKGIGPRQGVPGTAGVRFSVDAAGKLVAVELIQWSGIPDLDAEALALVRRAAFPPPPQGAQRTFVANVNFESRRR